MGERLVALCGQLVELRLQAGELGSGCSLGTIPLLR
jgi:hypothetical protein